MGDDQVPANLDQSVRAARRVCFFAHFHQDGFFADHVLTYLAALKQAGFATVVLSTASLAAGEESKLAGLVAGLIRRENVGLDFGGWIEACRRFFPIEADLLLLANDSVYAPIGDLSAFIAALCVREWDFSGAVESLEDAPHLQSWFLLFRPAAYRSAAFASLMTAPMRRFDSKRALVDHYEVGLTRSLAASGLRYHAAFTPRLRGGLAVSTPYNPAHLLWREVIEAGVPFLKIEPVRLNPLRVMDIGDWRAVVQARAPALVPLIEDDLARRGTRAAPSFRRARVLRRVYWPELRWLLLLDFRSQQSPNSLARKINRAAFHALERLAWVVRRCQALIEHASRRIGRRPTHQPPN